MIAEPDVELLPHKIIEKNKKRADKFNLVKAIFLDIFFVFYSLIVLKRAIYYKFILEMRNLPFSWGEIGILFLISIGIGIIWASTRTSLSCKLFGIAKQNKTTKWTVEIFGWFLFNITFIFGALFQPEF
jgi:hypothetical protein